MFISIHSKLVAEQNIILFSILNWGLGHAARSVPIIQYLQTQGYKIIICTDGHVVDFLTQELENVQYEYLPAYQVHYKHESMIWNMLWQGPKLSKAYFKARKAFKKLVKQYRPVLCISDNRYECFSQEVPSVCIAHQWNILKTQTSYYPIASKINQQAIKRFDALWIPDDANRQLTGLMTENIQGIPIDYLGILSRFSEALQDSEKSVFMAAILSGPEPRRTMLEKRFAQYCAERPKQDFILVRGTEDGDYNYVPSNCIVYNIVDKNQLLEIYQKSKYLMGRSGYSSVMDYLALGLKNIIYVPTKNQVEQEYLAKKLEQHYHIPWIAEEDIDAQSIDNAISAIEKTTGNISTHRQFPAVIHQYLTSL